MQEYLTLQEKRNKIRNQIFFWIAFVLVVGGGVWGVAALSKSSAKLQQTQNAKIASALASDHVRGDVDAKVTIVEYSDFQCPACRAAEPTVQKILSDYTGRVKLAYRYFPLINIHQQALLSSAAAEAAGKQGKFWEMHDLLFERQTDWAGRSDAQTTILGLAQSLNLKLDLFQTDLVSAETSKIVKDSYDSATEIGLNHTPTFFINGTELTDTSYDGFKTLIESKLHG